MKTVAQLLFISFTFLVGCGESAPEKNKYDLAIEKNYGKEIQPLMIQARQAEKDGDYKGCLQLLTKASEKEPTNFHIMNNIGLTYFKLQNIKESIVWLQKAVEANHENHQGWYNLGLCYRVMMKYDLALESFEHAIKHKEDMAPAYSNVGYCNCRLGNVEAGTKAHEQAITMDPGNLTFQDGLDNCEADSKKALTPPVDSTAVVADSTTTDTTVAVSHSH